MYLNEGESCSKIVEMCLIKNGPGVAAVQGNQTVGKYVLIVINSTEAHVFKCVIMCYNICNMHVLGLVLI
jgi:hypothetical protein